MIDRVLSFLPGMNAALAEAVTADSGTGTTQVAAGGDIISMVLMMAAMVAIFYFLLIRPQRKKDKQVKNMLAALKVGDRISVQDAAGYTMVKKNWFNGGSSVLKKGSYGYIYDIDTGITVRIKRMGGHYHADVEPATTADTAKLLKIANGKFSWKSHAVILKANGKYVASDINTLPHGDQTLKNNNYDGQFCLHTSGSKTHASSKENKEHQKSINRAYKWAHK